MKKILFATTALVASTSFAMADVNLAGDAGMGIFGGDDIDTQFYTDLDVTFEMTGETDGGLTFGAAVDLNDAIDQEDVVDDPAHHSGAVIFVSGAFGTLTMGDTDGAVDFALSEISIGSTLGDIEEHAGWSGNNDFDGIYDGQIARYEYSFGDFSIAASAEINDADDRFDDIDGDDITDDLGNRLDEISSDTVLGIGARYDGTFNATDFGVGIGYQRAGDSDLVDADGDGRYDDVDAASVLGVSLDMSMTNGLQAILNYSTYDNFGVDSIGTDDDLVGVELEDYWGLAVGYEFGAFLVSANYGVFSYDGAETSGFGLVGNYDLGGGAELQAGYARSEFEIDGTAGGDGVSGDSDVYSFGIAMNF